ncbi:hypothetical protein HPB49_006694 [Dermacentor silvarum]|uniref:Uncharacterized protein n=1 Tax=Dermacentor silvarum TaxID=543639 RepID=A0ACB8C7W3_DERSI|nr:hypothetical protein HPB49_006694 [Dermacentor silvarum]
MVGTASDERTARRVVLASTTPPRLADVTTVEMFFADRVSGSENTVAAGNGFSPRFHASFFGSAEERYRLLTGRVAAIAPDYTKHFLPILKHNCALPAAPTYAEDSDSGSEHISAVQSKGIIRRSRTSPYTLQLSCRSPNQGASAI